MSSGGMEAMVGKILFHILHRSIAITGFAVLAGLCNAQTSQRPESAPRKQVGAAELRGQLDRTAAQLGDHAYQLAYKYTAGQVLRYNVLHVVNVETTIEGSGQKSQSRSAAVKHWEVREATDQTVTIAHSIEEVDMSSESPGRAPVRYNSQVDKEVPGEYEEVAKNIGKPITVLTIDRWGNTLDRKDELKQVELGAGGLVVSFPKEPVHIDAEWSQPGTVSVRLTEGDYKAIKIRQLYRLIRVASGIATISVSTQVMTPVPDARVQSQLLQRLCNGTVKFDLDAGCVLSRSMEWNEDVVGFSGASSSMKYQARLTEELIPASRVANRPDKP